MIPRATLLLLLAALTLFGLLAAFQPAVAPAWWPAVGLLVIVAALDAGLLARTRTPVVTRQAPSSMSLATWTDIHLTIQNVSSGWPLHAMVYDHHPQAVIPRATPTEVKIAARHFVDIVYQVQPTQRGPLTFTACELRIASPFGLWWHRRILPMEDTVRTYPNYSSISKILAYQVDNPLQAAGLRQNRRRGEGIEFHQLRDYREGDSLRAIDWKATARMSRLISREYQDERDQQIVFVLDAGRRMLTKDARLSHFDHTLNAMLLLSFVALRQGDAVGVMTVGDRRSWLPPRKGVGAINGLLNHVYDVQPSAIEIDYVAAATDLSVRQRRRSLVIVLTNIREEDSDDLCLAVDLLRRRHLVIVASLRERALDDALEHKIQNFDDALLYAATTQYLDARSDSQKLLKARGVFVEDCLSDDLPSAITNRYLAIKRSGAL